MNVHSALMLELSDTFSDEMNNMKWEETVSEQLAKIEALGKV